MISTRRHVVSPSVLALTTLLLAGCEPVQDPAPSTQILQQVQLPTADPSTRADITYTLSFEDAARHLIDVQAVFPVAPDAQDLELMMAAWTPGSYLIREYARHVEGVMATDAAGEPLAVTKTRKNRWLVGTPGTQDSVHVHYRVYAREMTVRTNFVDRDIALLNGAPTFLIPVGGETMSHEVRLELPDAWPDSATALESMGEHRYFSPDFDTLVDSPIVIGPMSRHGFELDGVAHELVQAGEYELWDNEQAAADVARLTLEHIQFWGSIPYSHYVYLNAITESGGGLEHKNSTLMLTGRLRSGTDRGYRRWLGLVSHEFFHTWNVKRLRPAALGPFDYENENYTRSLWMAEGLTSYFGPLLLRRAELIDDKQFLRGLSSAIGRVQETPGRHVRSVADSSFDAWIKGYRPDENLRNTAVDYYGKGQVVGFLLDAEIRRRTAGRKSLDHVMRTAYERYSGETGFTPEDFRNVVAETAGEPLDGFFQRFVDGTEELDYGPALEWYGLRFKSKKKDDDEDEQPGWLGLRTEEDGTRLSISAVPRDTPAWDAGLNVDDEILAIDDFRVDAKSWDDRLKLYAPGTETHLWIARRGRLRQIPITFAQEPDATWKLEVDPEAGVRAKRRRADWLQGPS